MANVKFRLDHGGMAALLKSQGVAGAVEERARAVAAAAQVAPEITRNGMSVGVRSGVTDRARSVVTIEHPGGLGVQAKHGTLTRAVGSAGLSSAKVRGRANG